MQKFEKPRAARLVFASRILLWLAAALLAAVGSVLTIEGVTGPGDTAPELYIVPGVGGLLIAVVLALVGWSLRDSDTT